MEIVRQNFGFHPAFAVAAFGMVISVGILWYFKNLVLAADQKHENRNIGAQIRSRQPTRQRRRLTLRRMGLAIRTKVVTESAGGDAGRSAQMSAVPNWKRVMALIVIFIIVIVFWMVFHQNDRRSPISRTTIPIGM